MPRKRGQRPAPKKKLIPKKKPVGKKKKGTKKTSPPWRELEKTVAEIHRQLAPDAEVEHDIKVVGRSGRKRQLDVRITSKIGPYPVNIVLECRKTGRRVGIASTST